MKNEKATSKKKKLIILNYIEPVCVCIYIYIRVFGLILNRFYLQEDKFECDFFLVKFFIKK